MTTIVSLLTKNVAVVGSDLLAAGDIPKNFFNDYVVKKGSEIRGFKKLLLSKKRKLIIGRTWCLSKECFLDIDKTINFYLSQSIEKALKNLPRSIWPYLNQDFCDKGPSRKFSFEMITTYCLRNEFKIKHYEPKISIGGNSLEKRYSMTNYYPYNVIGAGKEPACDVLVQEYESGMSLKDGIEIAEKAIN